MGIIENVLKKDDQPFDFKTFIKQKGLDYLMLGLIVYAALIYRGEIDQCTNDCNAFIVENCDNYDGYTLMINGEVVYNNELDNNSMDFDISNNNIETFINP